MCFLIVLKNEVLFVNLWTDIDYCLKLSLSLINPVCNKSCSRLPKLIHENINI